MSLIYAYYFSFLLLNIELVVDEIELNYAIWSSSAAIDEYTFDMLSILDYTVLLSSCMI
jgi:hypothetical protein